MDWLVALISISGNQLDLIFVLGCVSAACLWSHPISLVPLAVPPGRAAFTVLDAGLPEQRLLERCQAADPAAWEELVRRHSPRVYNLCLRFTGRAHDAEDLTQEAFLRIFRNLASYRPEAGNFGTWVTALTRNLLVDHYRRGRTERKQMVDGADEDLFGAVAAPGHSAERMVWQRELELRVQQALVHLSPELREVIILRDLQDMDYSEIAAALALPLGTVKSRINRGRVELARLLRPAYADRGAK